MSDIKISLAEMVCSLKTNGNESLWLCPITLKKYEMKLNLIILNVLRKNKSNILLLNNALRIENYCWFFLR